MRFYAIALVSILAAACGPTSTDQDPLVDRAANGDGARQLRTAVQAICDARDAAESSAEVAEQTFIDDAHAGVHRLAADVAEVDRGAAARIHEAKAEAEMSLADRSPVAGRALDRLARAANDGLVALGTESVACVTGDRQR